MTDSAKLQYEAKIRSLLEENIQLVTENLRLKYGTTSTTNQSNYNEKGRKSPLANTPMSVMKKNKEKNLKIVAEEYNKETSIEDIAVKIGMSVSTVRNYINQLKQEQIIA